MNPRVMAILLAVGCVPTTMMFRRTPAMTAKPQADFSIPPGIENDDIFIAAVRILALHGFAVVEHQFATVVETDVIETAPILEFEFVGNDDPSAVWFDSAKPIQKERREARLVVEARDGTFTFALACWEPDDGVACAAHQYDLEFVRAAMKIRSEIVDEAVRRANARPGQTHVQWEVHEPVIEEIQGTTQKIE